MTHEEAITYAAEAKARAQHRAEYWSTNRYAMEARRADDLEAVRQVCQTEAMRSLPAVLNIINRRIHGNWN